MKWFYRRSTNRDKAESARVDRETPKSLAGFAPSPFFVRRSLPARVKTRMSRSLPALRGLLQAFLQRCHHVDHRSALGTRSSRNLTAFLLRFYQSLKPRFKFIMIFLQIEMLGEIVHQLISQFDFLRRKLHVFNLPISGRFTDFVRKIHGVKSNTMIVRPQKYC